MKKTLFIISNLIVGNLILALFVSSNFFLQSLMINFSIYFHICFSLLILSSSFFFLRLAKKLTSRFYHYLFGFLTCFIPVALTTLFLIGGPFLLNGTDDMEPYKTIVFALEFSTLVIFTTAAIYWIPFGLLNSIYMRKNFINKTTV